MINRLCILIGLLSLLSVNIKAQYHHVSEIQTPFSESVPIVETKSILSSYFSEPEKDILLSEDDEYINYNIYDEYTKNSGAGNKSQSIGGGQTSGFGISQVLSLLKSTFDSNGKNTNIQNIDYPKGGGSSEDDFTLPPALKRPPSNGWIAGGSDSDNPPGIDDPTPGTGIAMGDNNVPVGDAWGFIIILSALYIFFIKRRR